MPSLVAPGPAGRVDTPTYRWPMTRGQQGRRIGRAMIGLTIVLVIVAAIVWVADPKPMFGATIPSWPFTPPLLGVIGMIVGLAWMIRIHRANPEPDQHAWRYRA